MNSSQLLIQLLSPTKIVILCRLGTHCKLFASPYRRDLELHARGWLYLSLPRSPLLSVSPQAPVPVLGLGSGPCLGRSQCPLVPPGLWTTGIVTSRFTPRTRLVCPTTWSPSGAFRWSRHCREPNWRGVRHRRPLRPHHLKRTLRCSTPRRRGRVTQGLRKTTNPRPRERATASQGQAFKAFAPHSPLWPVYSLASRSQTWRNANSMAAHTSPL